jgi:uncharacterized membrane protein YfcA
LTPIHFDLKATHVNSTIIGVGFLVGVFIGVSGVGGSSLMTPLLILLLRIHPVVAIGTDLLYSVPTKLLGTYVHARERTIDRRLVWTLALGGIPAVIVGLAIAFAARRHFSLAVLDAFTRPAVGVALLISSVVLVVSLFIKKRQRDTVELTWTRATSVKIAVLGAVVGLAVSLTSIGGGAITLPVLYASLPGYALRRLVGSDVAFAAALIPLAALGHVMMGNVDLFLVANLLVGSLPGVVVGSKLCSSLPEPLLRPVVAGVLIFAGVRLI